MVPHSSAVVFSFRFQSSNMHTDHSAMKNEYTGRNGAANVHVKVLSVVKSTTSSQQRDGYLMGYLWTTRLFE
jgi:hypothetical protein